jgi:hypothetical protein
MQRRANDVHRKLQEESRPFLSFDLHHELRRTIAPSPFLRLSARVSPPPPINRAANSRFSSHVGPIGSI